MIENTASNQIRKIEESRKCRSIVQQEIEKFHALELFTSMAIYCML